MSALLREFNFDGIVGPTHNYGGLSPGNLASTSHGGAPSSPRRAALEGLAKMRFVRELGLGQAVLPPQERPSLRTLRRLGFQGSDEEVLARVARDAEHLLRLVSSSAAMWTANAATVAPSTDSVDGRLHLTPANLAEMFHRSLEAPTTTRILRAIFADPERFVVHDALPGSHFADEGAANHTRLVTAGQSAVHLFAWGRSGLGMMEGGKWQSPRAFPARQTREASEALARLHRLDPARCLFPQQHPVGIDEGAFHTDVLAVGNESFLMLHELAFVEHERLLIDLRERLGDALHVVLAREAELPVASAVAAYPFNSQVVTLPTGRMAILAPKDSELDPAARGFLERVVAEDNPVDAVHFVDLHQSMHNGGGPACLRLRVPLTPDEVAAIGPRVLFDDALHADLCAWVERRYPDEVTVDSLGDPSFVRDAFTALDELTGLLRLGSIYDFQQ